MSINKIKLEDNTILKDKHFYTWSGKIDNLYNNFSWENILCRISIDEEKKLIHVYEIYDNKDYIYTYKDINYFNFNHWWCFFKRKINRHE